MLISGPAGVGKTAVVTQLLAKLAEGGRCSSLALNFSARTSSGATQAAIESKLERRRQTKCAAWLATQHDHPVHMKCPALLAACQAGS